MRADDIVRQRFTKVFRGYDVQEVDLFLDEVIRTIDELEAERNQLLGRLEVLLQELDRCDRLIMSYQSTPTHPLGEGKQEKTRRMLRREPRTREPLHFDPVAEAEDNTHAAKQIDAPKDSGVLHGLPEVNLEQPEQKQEADVLEQEEAPLAIFAPMVDEGSGLMETT